MATNNDSVAVDSVAVDGTSLDCSRDDKDLNSSADVSSISRDESHEPLAPTHLVVVCHGVMGNPSHVANLCFAVQEALGPSALVLAPSCVTLFRTLSGTEACGDAVFRQLQASVREHSATLRHVSLIGYSFGGIVCRWVAGRLHEHAFFGLTPLNIVTIACPHLGVSDRGSGFGSRLVRGFVRCAGGATGEELSQQDDRRALLTWMSTPESPFFKGLAAFERRASYACLRGDRTVSFFTAYFPSGDECRDLADPSGGSAGETATLVASSRLSSACASCRPWGSTPGFVQAVAQAFPHVFVWRPTPLRPARAHPSVNPLGGCSADTVVSEHGAASGCEACNACAGSGCSRCAGCFVAAASFDEVPPAMFFKTALLALLATPFLACWLGIVLPLFALARGAARAVLGPAAPPVYPPGLGPPHAEGTPNRSAAHASREAMAVHLNALTWEKYAVVLSYRRDGLAALHTHGHAVHRSAAHAAGRDVVRHAAATLRAGRPAAPSGPLPPAPPNVPAGPPPPFLSGAPPGAPPPHPPGAPPSAPEKSNNSSPCSSSCTQEPLLRG